MSIWMALLLLPLGDDGGGGGGGGDEPASEGLLLENSSFVQLESGDFVLIEG
jgi:hypothetical protein